MIARLIALLRSRRIATGFDRGYSWAAGELLSGRKTIDDIEVMCDKPFDYDNPFDYGALDAVHDWRNLGRS